MKKESVLSIFVVFVLCGIVCAGIYDRAWIAQYSNSLSTAIEKIGYTTKKQVIIPTAITVDLSYQDMNVPANIDIDISTGGSIARTGGHNLIIKGTLTAPARQIFTDSNNWVILRNVGQDRKPEWWGGDPNDYTAYGKEILSSVTTAVKTTGFGTHSGNDITSGSCNTWVGYMALEGITTGGRNVGIGDYAGSTDTGSNKCNISIGSDAGRGQRGDYSVFVGDLSGYLDPNDPNSYNSTICLGHNTIPTRSGECVIGSNDPNSTTATGRVIYITFIGQHTPSSSIEHGVSGQICLDQNCIYYWFDPNDPNTNKRIRWRDW